ncbi:MAG: DUF1013 domain-containing protein [Alphaproteobacteria bacterium]|nr:DUF1013 domain-containing protein [Alphaproteobacteria bacterium]
MALPLMPKATAVWLIDNTSLTFDQIGEFCGLHKLEVQAIADGEVASSIVGLDPLLNGQLTQDEIKRCEADPRARLKMVKSDLPQPVVRTKGARYTPVSKRNEKPDAIAYLLKNYPDLLDAQIARLLGTTKETINKVRDRSHWNSPNIKPQNPILLGLCKQADLEAAVKRAERRVEREKKAQKKARPGKSFDEIQAVEDIQDGFVRTPNGTQDDQPDIDPDAMLKE